MLRYRLIFGPLMIAVALVTFWADAAVDKVELTGFWQKLFLGRTYPPAGVVLAVMTVCLLIPMATRELAHIFRADGIIAHTWLISMAAMFSCLTVYSTPMMLKGPTGITIIASVLVGAFVITLLWHSRDANVKGVVAAAGATMFAVVLLGLMPGFYLAMRRWHAAWVVVAVILITKSCDIGAYFSGRYLGRHKMIPWLSPKKTWEGLAGGMITASLVAVGFAYISQVTDVTEIYRTVDGGREFFVPRYSLGWAAIAGALFALVGQLGDLMVSLFKRDVGIKDSGASIPGFGGMLDVFDSPLLVAPVAYWMLHIAAKV